QTKHGYARGWEPVMYVEKIRNYLDILTWLTKQEKKPLDQHQPVTSTIARNNNAELTEQNSRERG
ncbi:MAG: membrane-bound lytic murein transglycosylase MltF, partial [Gammaproteobacteria bacterium]|nr:membrane-bound lytic murein transglycosylase MltF [Gammaproteobacteria bacterium]